MKTHTVITVALLLIVLISPSYPQSKRYYVDATGGSDANSGLSPAAPWRSIARVNRATFAPGDSVLFRGGETFRGSLVACSGSSAGYVTYSFYGPWVKPMLLASYDRSAASDWTYQGGSLWRTTYRSVEVLGSELLPNPEFYSNLASWEKYDDPAGSTVSTLSRTTVPGEYYTPPAGAKLAFAVNGSTPSVVQLFTMPWPVTASKWYHFSFNAKANRPFVIPRDKIVLHQQGPPWTRYSSSISPSVAIKTQWSSYDLYYLATSTANDSRITFYFSDYIANGDTLYIDALSFKECAADPEPLAVDVGNVIFNSEKSVGKKVWGRSDLNAQGKFWYDEQNNNLEMYSNTNPGSYYSHIELALNMNCIGVDNTSYVAFEYLDLRYGVFGIAGTNTHHILIKGCDISYIGGHRFLYGDNDTTRYGNGVQFWNAAHDDAVERCSFNQIYDAAVTAQGSDVTAFDVYNIYFRNNIIRNSEYSFEFWEGGAAASVHDVYFENNTCLDAGGGWGHLQRPDPNGTHLMLFPMFAQSANLFVRNNIFSAATDQSIRWWRKEDVGTVMLDNNCWYQPAGVLLRIDIAAGIGQVNITYDYATQWEAYRTATKEDSNSIHADPLLNSDQSLQAASPCIDAGKTLSTVQTDIQGVARPQGAGYDMGAFEAPASLIAPPLLIVPSDNTKKASITPLLTWSTSRRATNYRLVVSTAPDFSGLAAVDTTIADSSRVIGPLRHGTIYYWRVQAINGSWASDWSQERCFTTIAETPLGPAYYVSPSGNDANPGTDALPWKTLEKAATTATAGVTIFIKQGSYSERLLPVHSGTAGAWVTFAAYPGDSVTITGTGLTPPSGWWAGLIWAQGRKYIKFSGLRVTNSPNTGINVEQCSFITIDNNCTDSTNASGIKVYDSDNVLIQGNEVVHGCLTKDEESLSVTMAAIVEVRNNRIHDGLTEGIDVKNGCTNCIVTGNEVYNQGSCGIYIEAWDKHEFNIEVYNNVSHDNVQGIAVAAENGGLIEAIRIHNNVTYKNERGIIVAGWGIGQTHSIRNIRIYANDTYGNQAGVEIGGYAGTTMDSVRVYNNLIYRNTRTGVRISRFDGPGGQYAMSNTEIVNNTICFNGSIGNGWDPDNTGMNLFNVVPDNIFVRNNIFSGNGYCTIYLSPDVQSGTITIDYNFFNGFRNVANETAGTNAQYGIPLFVDSLGDNYRLQATSPCIDKGNPDPTYNDPLDPAKPGSALAPARGTIRNDVGAFGGPSASFRDLQISVAKPQTPVLNSPADSATGVSTTPTLSWNGILGSDMYRVQLSATPSFGSRLVDDSVVTDSYRQVGPLQSNATYYWRVSATNVAGTSSYSTVRTFTTSVASAVEQLDGVTPTMYSLSQNYPNPFNPSTRIRFGLPKSGFVSLKVYDILGRELETLVEAVLQPAYYQIQWNARVPSGIYLYSLHAGEYVESRKMIVLK